MDRERYSRQILFAPLGAEGQARLARARVAIVGCGALGSSQAELLTRAGVGALRLIDRDVVEPSNLQRQTLYTEADAAAALPKAAAAAARLGQINSAVEIEPQVADLTPGACAALLEGCDLILDGSDNLEARYLINDLAVKRNVPWIYGAAVASRGMTFTIRPGVTACLACVFPDEDATVALETCETSGVLGWVVQWVATLQVAEAVKLLTGRLEALRPSLIHADLWSNRFGEIHPIRDPQCQICGQRDFVHLRDEARAAITLCGRNAVQIHEHRRQLDLAELESRLRPHGEVRANQFALRFAPAAVAGTRTQMTIFPDGRALIQGTSDTALARSLYARFVGA